MIFFDMDGVLTVYNPDDYVGDPMPFNEPGIHYFADRPRDEAGIAMLDDLCVQLSRQSVSVVTTLSAEATATPSLRDEHMADKRLWLAANVEADVPLYFAEQDSLSKATVAANALGRSLSPCDILIDDFNGNLISWEMAGGRGIKYLNGHNSASSWNGPCVAHDFPKSSVRTVLDVLSETLRR